jgi:hypothetical protein
MKFISFTRMAVFNPKESTLDYFWRVVTDVSTDVLIRTEQTHLSVYDWFQALPMFARLAMAGALILLIVFLVNTWRRQT